MKKLIKNEKGITIKVQTIFPESEYNKPRTKQAFKEQCDVNNIIKRYQNTGTITHIAKSQGMYTDLPNSTSYFEAMNQVLAARDAFDTLPSQVRKEFGHKPEALLDFLADPKNDEQAIAWGLRDKPQKLPQGSNTSLKQQEIKPEAEPKV